MRAGSVKHWKIRYGEYWHHVLDFRDYPLARRLWGPACIVELARNPMPGVRRLTWEMMLAEAGGSQPVLVRTADRDLKAILRRAKRKLDSRFYCVIRYNCEHFAHECMTGKRRSNQVQFTAAQILFALALVSLCALYWEAATRSLVAGSGVALCGVISAYLAWRVAALAAAGSGAPAAHRQRAARIEELSRQASEADPDFLQRQPP